MLSSAGDGYTITLFDNETVEHRVETYSLVLVHSGRFAVEGAEVPMFWGAEALAPATVYGSGTCAVVSTNTDVAVDLPPTRKVVINPCVLANKPWGWELEAPNAAWLLQLKLLFVERGHRTSLQYHKEKDEVMMYLDGPSARHVEPLKEHRVAGPRLYFEASTYHPDDVVRVADDYGRRIAT
jgi:hypothetical protein